MIRVCNFKSTSYCFFFMYLPFPNCVYRAGTKVLILKKRIIFNMRIYFFSNWVFFHKDSRFTGQQGKGESIYLTPLYHFQPLHGHLDISWAITTDNSPLHIVSSRTGTGNLWFPSASR